MRTTIAIRESGLSRRTIHLVGYAVLCLGIVSCTGGETSQPVTNAGAPSPASPPAAPPATPPPGPTPVVAGTFPLLFVTQVPVSGDFTAITATFGNHNPSMQQAPRGGDLWIRYPDGAQKNLTKTAGFGMEGMQLAQAIAVRDPSMHWDGQKALFSMVIGAPTTQFQVKDFFWQLYEITGLGKSDTPLITKISNQPPDFNNVSPIYGTDGRIIYTSDRPRSGEKHLYPQHDEYESTAVVSGLWSLDPVSGDLFLLNHAPSGNFTPSIDSFGRVVFTQWDHLKRDQQADADKYAGGTNGTFTYVSEAANAQKIANLFGSEIFPEPRVDQEVAGTNMNKHDFNHFFPWTILEDGTEGETLNHLGRQELHSYLPLSLNDDPNVIEFFGQLPRLNQQSISNVFQIKEDPLKPGRYYGVDAPEFGTRAGGQVIFLDAPPSQNPDAIAVTYVTHRDTASFNEDNQPPAPNHSGHYRDPLPLSDGGLVAAHTAETRKDGPTGTASPSRYDYRLKTLKKQANGFWRADQPLTAGIAKGVSYWDPDTKIIYSGNLWELQPVEVKPRGKPAKLTVPLPAPEQQTVQQAGINLNALRTYLIQNNLALAVMRNVTIRDDADRQQPFNLHVPGGVQTVGAPGKLYDIQHFQLFQADQVRGLGGINTPRAGRRVLARALHESSALSSNKPNPNGPPGSVAVASDGSVAAFVPARRALSWQLTDPQGTPVVRERYWVTFQPGEIRVCASCHGVNDKNQAGNPAPTNPPQALLELLQYWKAQNP